MIAGYRDGRYTPPVLKKYFKDVSREFDEFRVNSHICKLRCGTCNILCG